MKLIENVYTKCPFCDNDVKYYAELTPSGWPLNIKCECGAIGDWYNTSGIIIWSTTKSKTTNWIKENKSNLE